MMDVPFVYSTNGDSFIEHDRTAKSGVLERELPLDTFPAPEELWRRYCAWKGIDDTNKEIVTQDYYTDSTGKIPRYYQLVAINRTIEAIARGQDRILLVMATGTGKTFTAFQIIWRLWKSRMKKRIPYLADRNILIDQRIQSMTVFKQIIGRGTRINEDFDKYYFTIMDFKKATELFADPLFDGDPAVIYEPGPHDPPVPPDEPFDSTKRAKFVVSDVPVKVIAESVQYYGKDGKLITESLKDYTRNTVKKEYASLDLFLSLWSKAEKKKLILQELEGHGLLLDALAEQVGRDYDPFDLICHVVYDKPPLSRRERAEAVRKKNYFSKFGEKARAVLTALLDKYADSGIENIESMEVLRVQPLNQFGTPLEIISLFGGKEKYLAALRGLETQIYMAEA